MRRRRRPALTGGFAKASPSLFNRFTASVFSVPSAFIRDTFSSSILVSFASSSGVIFVRFVSSLGVMEEGTDDASLVRAGIGVVETMGLATSTRPPRSMSL